MHTLTLDAAKLEFEALVAKVLADAEPTVVKTPGGESVVVVPLDDYEAWQETVYLLRNPANAAHLRKSLEESQSGHTHPRNLVE